MLNKKGAQWYYLVLFGFIMGIVFFFFFSSKDVKNNFLNGAIFEQLVERDLEAGSMRSYLSFSGQYALTDAIYALAENGGGACGEFAGFNLLQTKERGECMGPLHSTLRELFSQYLDAYLANAPASLPAENYIFTSYGEPLKVYATAKQPAELPQFTQTYIPPFDYYTLDGYVAIDTPVFLGGKYEVKISDSHSTPGKKFVFADA